MNKQGKKHQNPRHSQEDKIIKKLYEDLNKHMLEPTNLSQILNNKKTAEMIKIILSKKQKNETDVFIVKTFLKQLSSFMSIINKTGDEKKAEKLLTKISTDLSLEVYQKNSFLMKVGEVGKNFFVTLSGKVSVIVPKVINIQMTESQYKSHLIFLFNNNEKFLLEKTFAANKNLFKFELSEVEIKNDDFIIEVPLKISIEEYISRINCDNLINVNEFIEEKKEVKIFGYFIVVDLSQGSSFGEIALINENNQRTATIFVKDDSFFGSLTAYEYQNSMKKIQERIKVENIEFIFSYKIFNSIGIKLFTLNYWNYFISEKIHKKEYLFRYNELRNKIFFIQEGEVKLIIPFLNVNKLNKYIKNLTKNNLENKIEPIVNNDNVVIAHSKRGDILGLENILYDGNFICDAICTSKSCSYISIDINILEEIKKNFQKVNDSFNAFQKKKINLMINRLNTIKFTHQSSVHGEIIKNHFKGKSDLTINQSSSLFDSNGQEIIIKEAKLKKIAERFNMNKDENQFRKPKRLSQIFFDTKMISTIKSNTETKKKEKSSISSSSNLPSSISLKFDHETGNIINRKEKRKKTLNYSISELSDSNSNNSSSFSSSSSSEINQDLNNNNENNKLPLINNSTNYNNNNNNNITNNNNTINNNNNINNNKISLKKYKVLRFTQKPKTNLIKFNPIQTETLRFRDRTKEKIKEEEIKNSMSFKNPNDFESKQYYNNIIKKYNNVDLCLSKTLNNNFRTEKGKIYQLRLFDNQLEKFLDGKKYIKFNESYYGGFKTKIIPPQYLVHGKKINLKLLKNHNCLK